MNIFECRCCAKCVSVPENVYTPKGEGWKEIAHIDGSPSICPECVGDPHALDALIEDGYPNAHVIK